MNSSFQSSESLQSHTPIAGTDVPRMTVWEAFVHCTAVLSGVAGLLLIVALTLAATVTSVPCLVLSLLVLGIWKVFWYPVYFHIYLPYCKWIHVYALKSRGSPLSLKWCEIPGANIGRDRKARVFAMMNFNDNYSYLIVEEEGETGTVCAAVVDPGEADKIADCIIDISRDVFCGETVDVVAILTTHHHWDHMAGNAELPQLLYQKYMDISPDTEPTPPASWRVFASERVPHCTSLCSDGEVIQVGPGLLRFEVIALPCHTEGSVAYSLEGSCVDGRDSVVFSGDTVFHGGAGAVFEGNETQMTQNHAAILERCRPEAFVYCGHEYSPDLLVREVCNDRVVRKPQTFYAAASALQTSNHRVLCTHPTIPLMRISSLIPVSQDFRQVWDYTHLILGCIAHTLTDDETLPLVARQASGCGTPDSPSLPLANGNTMRRSTRLAPANEFPVTSLYTKDLERLETRLLSGELSGAEAGARLRTLREEWYRSGKEMTTATMLFDVKHADAVVGFRVVGEAAGQKRAWCGDSTTISLERIRRVADCLNVATRYAPKDLLKVLARRAVRCGGEFTSLASESEDGTAGERLPSFPLPVLLEALNLPAEPCDTYDVLSAFLPYTPFDLRMSNKESCPLCDENVLVSH